MTPTMEAKELIVKTRTENFGRGEVQVVEVIPPNIAADIHAVQNARRQIYVQPYHPSDKGELNYLRDDLKMLAAIEANSGGEQIIPVGVAYTGERSNDARIVSIDGLPDGVKVTHLQVEKARDLIDATNGLIKGTNAEVVAFSAGGPVAQIALALGLKADTVGLFNASGLDNKNNLRIHGRMMLEFGVSLIKKPIDKIVDLLKYREKKDPQKEQERLLPDRLKRSRAEQLSAGRARTHLLPGISTETQFIVGNSKWDVIYPRRRIRKVFREIENQNVSFVDLGWWGHIMGRNPARRRERLAAIDSQMQAARAH